jgi:hypothetical protein
MAQSSTLAVSGPMWSREVDKGSILFAEIKPYVGFNPTIPQSEAGIRIDPPVSLPIAART